jgi:putative transposase
MQDFKKLPHINIINTYQFVTFRTKDSVDDFVKKISQQNTSNKIKYQQIDNYLDHSKNGCYLNNQVITALKDFFINKKDTYELIALSIMPNHIHILFKQTKDLAKTMQNLKGGSAFLVNKLLNKTGVLWEKGYFDKGIRNQEHFDITYNYIKNNALKAGLKDFEIRFYGVYG